MFLGSKVVNILPNYDGRQTKGVREYIISQAQGDIYSHTLVLVPPHGCIRLE